MLNSDNFTCASYDARRRVRLNRVGDVARFVLVDRNMATTTAMNRWAEELVASLMPVNTPPSKLRRLKASFNRSIRYHNYGRTNQFEVENRLAGLEEKFQVLDHDELSDALHQRREELRQHFEQWIPDALDFLLQMSKEPMAAGGVDALRDVVLDDLVTPQLTWAEIEKDDPVNRKDWMWRVPHFSDESSDEEPEQVSVATSPSSVKQTATKLEDDDPTLPFEDPGADALGAFKQNIIDDKKDEVLMTEIQVIRETLFMVQGLPTALFTIDGQQIKQNHKYKVAHMSSDILASLLSQAILIARAASLVRNWHAKGVEQPFLQVLQDGITSIAGDFDAYLSGEHTSVLQAMKAGGVCSVLAMVDRVRHQAQAVAAAAQLISSARDLEGVDLLQILFEHVCRIELCGQKRIFEKMLSVFCGVLKAYMYDVEQWVEQGRLPQQPSTFFVERVTNQDDKAKLFHNWYLQTTQTGVRLPQFLQVFSSRIFAAGKTVAFLNMLPKSSIVDDTAISNFERAADAIKVAQMDTLRNLVPFAPTLLSNIQRYVDQRLAGSTTALQTSLEKHCNLQSSLQALSHLYLAEAPYATKLVDEHLFEALDHHRSSWNDQYMVLDILGGSFAAVPAIAFARITIQSEPLPPSSLREACRSVKTLELIAIDYCLPWPIANIIPTDSVASYRRVCLMLTQIRRARYVLERHAFPNLQRHSRTKISVEGIFTNLLLFANTLYSHFMHCAVKPLTWKLRSRMTGTVDEMMAIHKYYTVALERICLTTKSLKVLRETLISLLDLCVSFGFEVAEAKNEIDGFELSKIKTQFRKYMNLLVAGLRGSARAGTAAGLAGEKNDFAGSVSEVMTLLADSLESAGFKM